MKPLLFSLLFFCLPLASIGHSQIRPGDNGIYVVSGNLTAGNLCRGFRCRPYSLVALRNIPLEVQIRGPKNNPFWLFLSAKANLCLLLPGLRNNLILNPPLILVSLGTLSLQDSIRACPGGLAKMKFKLPSLPPKTFFYLQALIVSNWIPGKIPTFSPAVQVSLK